MEEFTEWVQIARCLGMALKPKRPPAEGEFLFEIDPEPLEECVTSLDGVPLVVRAARSLGVPDSVQRNLHLKKRDRGLDEPRYAESFPVLDAVAGIAWRTSIGCGKMCGTGPDAGTRGAGRRKSCRFRPEPKNRVTSKRVPENAFLQLRINMSVIAPKGSSTAICGGKTQPFAASVAPPYGRITVASERAYLYPNV